LAGKGSAFRQPSVSPRARASRKVAQAWASGSAKSRTDSLPTVARTRPMALVSGSTRSTTSHDTPSSAQATCLSAVAICWPISMRGSASV
jgi:hypothetical protein